MTKTKNITTIMLGLIVVASLMVTGVVTQNVLASQDTQETETRVTKNEQYLAEARVAFDKKIEEQLKIVEYEKQKNITTSEQEKQELDNKIQESLDKVSRLDYQIRQLEKLNKTLYKMESELKERFDSAGNTLFDKYINTASADYVGDNPVELVHPDILRRTIILVVNPDKVSSDGSNVPSETNVNGFPVVIKHGMVQEMSCTNNSREGVCRPLIGGVSIADQERVPDLNTLGYRASLGGVIGFVIAGHSVDGEDSIVVQPGDDSDEEVGVVTERCKQTTSPACDYAFVDVDSGISVNNEIFLGSGLVYDIVSKTPDEDQTFGTFVQKSGAGSGNTLGDISFNGHHNTAEMNDCQGGDSGAPIFWESGNDAELFGINYACVLIGGDWFALYYPWDDIEDRIGADPTVPLT